MSQPEILRYGMGKGVIAFSTTRRGGVGNGAYAAFNITDYCGDDAFAVKENRKRLCNMLEIDDDHLLLPRQTHATNVLCVDDDFIILPAEERQECLFGVDALVTSVPGICIGVSTADCVPVLLFDAHKHVVAAVHAGWRGTVGRIVEKALNVITTNYGVAASDICAVVGPSISLAAFEVGDEVYDAFDVAAFPMERIASRIGGKWHIDLWEANRLQLLASGVNKDNISVCGICTHGNSDRFFSARRLGINSGRIFNGIMLE